MGNSTCGKTRWVSNVFLTIFDYFLRAKEHLGVERHQRGLTPSSAKNRALVTSDHALFVFVSISFAVGNLIVFNINDKLGVPICNEAYLYIKLQHPSICMHAPD